VCDDGLGAWKRAAGAVFSAQRKALTEESPGTGRGSLPARRCKTHITALTVYVVVALFAGTRILAMVWLLVRERNGLAPGVPAAEIV